MSTYRVRRGQAWWHIETDDPTWHCRCPTEDIAESVARRLNAYEGLYAALKAILWHDPQDAIDIATAALEDAEPTAAGEGGGA